MSLLHLNSNSFSHLKLLTFTSKLFFSTQSSIQMMNNASSSQQNSPNIAKTSSFRVPDIDHISEETYQRYTSKGMKRNGVGVAIVWFRNDLRVLDNEALYQAWRNSQAVLPVYCVDPNYLFGTTHYFGFPKTGALRAQFLVECLEDLKKNLTKRGLNLLIRHGKPEDILPSIAKDFGAHTVYAHKETCSEELTVERRVREGLLKLGQNGSKLQLIWGSTMYHIDDLPFLATDLPDVYTQFRKTVETKCNVRSCFKIPTSLGPLPHHSIDEFGGWGDVPSLDQFGLKQQKINKGMCCLGGENAALSRVNEYFWKKDLLRVYKETRNGMLGADYSTKFSPWLASGCISPRLVHEEVTRYEKERVANESTYWVLFELIWRDYFRFLAVKYGNSLFHVGGPRNVQSKNWTQNRVLFESWREGRTGYPIIDANMKELSATGFMSNRGRQIVCSFLVRDMGIDWRMGAEWFETCLLDYDPCSNYGNWTYGAGVGNDPREDRYFSIPKQAQNYDREGEYVSYWLPELEALPKDKRHFPGKSYITQIVPLKFGNNNQRQGHGNSNTNTNRKQSRVYGKGNKNLF
ncbi:deoxyribodipyrimidine photo-lyase [Ranunculus cassubicifolius]